MEGESKLVPDGSSGDLFDKRGRAQEDILLRWRGARKRKEAIVYIKEKQDPGGE